ncbi:MAG: transglutaminase-like domain-containing protein [Oscillospiraceae bacterium]|nr:transglutaminase-like domain-containing protein [Oscillospiraceae bacterium]
MIETFGEKGLEARVLASKLLRKIAALLGAVLLACLPSCAPAEEPAGPAAAGGFVIAEMKSSGFNSAAAESREGVSADFSSLTEGYVAISAVSESRLKLQVLLGEGKYTYDLKNDGTPEIFPLNMGDGEYSFRVMENISGTKYAELWSETRAVSLASEFEPFLRPSQYVNYDVDSECVARARELAAACADDIEVVAAVYGMLVESIEYDHEKAASVQSGYLPDPDTTLATRKGICFDYAALAAAMLRSLGVPCRLITGYVHPNEIYHAWNEVYIESQGWITVKIEVSAESWKRVDITFAAGGVSEEQLDDDSLYTTRYVY